MLGAGLIIFVFIGFSTALDLSACTGRPKEINVILQGLQGDIYSPGYKEGVNYPDNVNCAWAIKAPFGFKVRLSFVDFALDVVDLCLGDAIAVFDGNSPLNPVHGVFCGNDSYPDIVSVSNGLYLFFRSDFMVGKKGFHLRYSASNIERLCGFGYAPCRNRRCYKMDSTCNGIDDCGDGTDEEDCGHPPQTTTCGKRLNDTLSVVSPDRIVGGRQAIPFSWPWQADLQLSLFNPNGHSCGGTLINAQWILTAAHCFLQNGHPDEWRIHLGNHHKFKKDKYEQVRAVVLIVGYPEMSGEEINEMTLDLKHDIALMKLNAPVKFNDRVRPACLPTQNYHVKTNTKCMASGWGSTRGTGSSHVLKEVELYIEDYTTCLNEENPVNNKTMICVNNRHGNQDVCHGDSGGPLVCKINGEWQVMGATSHGTSGTMESGLCALPGSYTVYSKVSDKINWIRKMINKYS